jgi:hypothetical protein
MNSDHTVERFAAIVLLAVACACARHREAQSVSPREVRRAYPREAYRLTPDVEVSLSQGGILWGKRPEYEVTIRGDGTVIFNGKRNVQMLGLHTKKISPDALKPVLSIMADIDFLAIGSTRDPSRLPCLDHAAAAVTLRVHGQEHTVHHDLGCSGDPVLGRLTAIEMGIFNLAAIDVWNVEEVQREERREILRDLSLCADATSCDEVALQLAPRALAIWDSHAKEGDGGRILVCRDGTVWARDDELPTVGAMVGRLDPVLRSKLNSALAPSPASGPGPDFNIAHRMAFMLAVSDGKSFEVRSYGPGGELPPDVRSLGLVLNEIGRGRAYLTFPAKIRIDAVAAPAQVTGATESWPAAAAKPADVLGKLLSAEDWRGLQERFREPDRKSAERRALNGAEVGVEGPAVLIVRADGVPFRPLCQ